MADATRSRGYRRWTHAIFVLVLAVSAAGVASGWYWYALWPLPPGWVIGSSPWIEPRIRALARASDDEFSDLYDLVDRAMDGLENQQRAIPGYVACLRSSDDHLRRICLHLAFRMKPYAGETSREIVQELVRAAEDPDPEFAVMGCWALHSIPREVAIPVWRRLLGERATSPQVREQALDCLSVRYEFEATPWVLPYLSDPDPSIRFAALHAVWEIEDPQALDAVRRMLDDSDSAVRAKAVEVSDFLSRKPEASLPTPAVP